MRPASQQVGPKGSIRLAPAGSRANFRPCRFARPSSSEGCVGAAKVGGNITIDTGEFLKSADSLVSASSELGVSGTVDLIGPRVDFNGALISLQGELRAPVVRLVLGPNSLTRR
jgi:hypothetical protein